MRRVAQSLLGDLFVLAAGASVVWGAAQVYRPAAFIVAGPMLAFIGLSLLRGAKS